jgi:hypothetical protein
MNTQLTVNIAQAHQYDLRRAAERWNVATGTGRRSRRIARRRRLGEILRHRPVTGLSVARPAPSH